jgi:hypothetical protein
MSPNQPTPSHGQKVDLGRNAPVTNEGTGKVDSQSLAAESGAFASGQSRSENTSGESGHEATHATIKDNAPTDPTRYAQTAVENPSASASEHTSSTSKQSSAGTAPSYVANQYIRDNSGPHGKNIIEGGWDESKARDGLQAALASEPGSKDDPSRLAEMQFQQNQLRGARDAGPKQGELSNETKYDGLKSDVPA